MKGSLNGAYVFFLSAEKWGKGELVKPTFFVNVESCPSSS